MPPASLSSCGDDRVNKKAQLAITDAVIFLLLMSLGAAFSLISSSSQLGFAEIETLSDTKDYAEDTFIVLMRSTLDLGGCGMNYSEMAIDRYMLMRTSAEDDGHDVELLAPCDMLLFDFARDLIVARYDFKMASSYVNESSGRTTKIEYAEPGMVVPSEYFEIGWDYPMGCFEKRGNATVSLLLWHR